MIESAKSHTTIRNGKLFCYNCGTFQPLGLPKGIGEVTELMGEFDKLHKDCKPTWKAPEPDMSKTRDERIKWWMEYGEHGTSSKTIWSFMVVPDPLRTMIDHIINVLLAEVFITPNEYCHPSDPDDFRRCYLLLKAVPEWKPLMVDMKKISPAWSKLVDNWDKLTDMLESEDKGIYNFMKSLIE